MCDMELPVGLCRMKNKNDRSTTNQGGDDRAVTIAARQNRTKTRMITCSLL